MKRRILSLCLTLAALASPAAAAPAGHGFDGRSLQAQTVERIARDTLAKARIPALGLAIVDDGKVSFLGAYGQRDVAKALPLRTDTVMYAASLTKAAFGYLVAELADEGAIDLDAPISRYLKKPLPEYDFYKSLAGDERWKKLTPRLLMGHSSGFANFAFLEPDKTLKFHFTPGERYAYSGEGIQLMQFVLEEGLGLDIEAEMKRRMYGPFNMPRTSMKWREDFAGNLTTGYFEDGTAEGHHKRARVRAAGNMDTTIGDYANFLAALTRGAGLSPAGQAQIRRQAVPIRTPHQFPTMGEPDTDRYAPLHLASGLGWLTFDGPYGKVIMKGGHDDYVDNLALCTARRCILMMTNSGVGARMFPTLVKRIMGDPGVPWTWEYNPVLPLEATAAPAPSKPSGD